MSGKIIITFLCKRVTAKFPKHNSCEPFLCTFLIWVFWGLGGRFSVCFRNNPELRGNSQYGTKDIFLNHLGASCHPDGVSGYFPQTTMIGHNPAHQRADVTTSPASCLLKTHMLDSGAAILHKASMEAVLGALLGSLDLHPGKLDMPVVTQLHTCGSGSTLGSLHPSGCIARSHRVLISSVTRDVHLERMGRMMPSRLLHVELLSPPLMSIL